MAHDPRQSPQGPDLSDEPLPAIAVDLARAQIIAANRGGLAAFGLDANEPLPIALDVTMPALVALRARAGRGQFDGTLETLRFWSGGRLLPLRCRASPHAANGTVRTVILRISQAEPAPAPGPAAEVAPTPPAQQHRELSTRVDPDWQPAPLSADACEPVPVAPLPEPAAAPPRSDAETLQEIARRIRAGVSLPARDEIPRESEVSPPANPSGVGFAAAAAWPSLQTLQAMAAADRSRRDEPSAAALPSASVTEATASEVADTQELQTPVTPGNDDNAEAARTPARPVSSRLADPALRARLNPAPAASPGAATDITPGDLAKLAHELKTPLSAIAAAAEIMRDERLGPMGNSRYLGYAADIHNAVTHSLDLIARLLTQATGGAAVQDRPSTIELNSAVGQAVSMMQPLASERGITLDTDLDEGTPTVIASKTALNQILLNLLTNALKFTPAGGDVRAVTGYLADGAVYVVVRDTGSGMPAARVRSLSGPASADSALSAGLARGSGIGLPLVRKLAREMGAEVEIESAPHKGTVVLLAFTGRRR